MKFICNTITLIFVATIMHHANAQENRLLHENEVSEAVVINALAPEKSSRTRSFIPLGEERDAKVSPAPSASILITFNTNSAELTHGAKEALDKIGRALNMDKLAEFSFTIEGHADLSGTYQFNQHLSKARADTVKSYLINWHHIEPRRLSAIGKGYTELINKHNPLAPENRRVKLVRNEQ